jgi:hypothetical protein
MEFDNKDGLHQDDVVKVVVAATLVEGCVRMRRTS